MSPLTSSDRKLLRTWGEHGIPDDQPTERDAICLCDECADLTTMTVCDRAAEIEQLARATGVLTDPPPARHEVDYDQLAAQRYPWHAARRRGWTP